MSIPIAATPTLYGKEAERFQKQADENKKKYVHIDEMKESIRIFLLLSNGQKEMEPE